MLQCNVLVDEMNVKVPKDRGRSDTDCDATEIFTVELQKGVRGLGLGLIDGLVSIFEKIKHVP